MNCGHSRKQEIVLFAGSTSFQRPLYIGHWLTLDFFGKSLMPVSSEDVKANF
jgi:hypothetical protein